MKHQKIQINKRLIGTILMGAGLAIIMLLAFNLAVMAGMLAPPQVVEISPANGSHNAGVDAPISITYDQAMDPATVNPQSFVVHAMQTGWLTETLHVDGGMIVLQPTSPLHAGELVQVTATTATLSLEGEAPLEPTVWQFTTAPWGGNAVFHFSQFIADSTGQEGAMADLNQDGFPDVITVNWIGNVRIFHNDGHGQFNEAQYLSFPGYNLVGSAVGDLDGDGDLDAVLIDNTNHDNRVLWNNGDGKFTDGGPAFWSSHDWTARLGDVDGDGDLDVIVVSGGIDNTGTARTWRNDGEGHFSLLEEFDAPYSHTGLAIGDLNNDGSLDVFTTGTNSSFNKVWLNDGTGHFTEAQSIPNANTFAGLLGDLNGDGNLDIYLSNITSSFENLPDEVWLNDGTGHFTNSGQSLLTASSAAPGMGDLDADGDLDVYIASAPWEPGVDEVWANDGLGNFSLWRTVDENMTDGFATLADLDNDGDLDVGALAGGEGYRFFLNGIWTRAEPIPTPVGFYGYAQCADDQDHHYIIGGWDGIAATDNAWRYDVISNTWTALPPLPFVEGIITPTSVCYDGHIYMVTGGPLRIYDIATNSWSVRGEIPRFAGGGAVGAWDGKLYRVGGVLGSYDVPPYNHVDVYNIATDTWTLDGGTPVPQAVLQPGYIQVGQYLYVVGGTGVNSPAHNVDIVQRYDMASDTWETIPFPSARGLGIALAYNGNRLYAIGGDLDGNDYFEATDLVETLDLSTWPNSSWELFSDPMPFPVQGNAAGFCTESISGGEIWSVSGGYVDGEGITHMLDANLYHPTGKACVHNAVELPVSMQDYGVSGGMVSYSLSITNTGNITDYYSLSISSTWDVELSLDQVGPVGAGETVNVIVWVNIPTDASPGDQGITIVSVSSLREPNIDATTHLTTTIWHRMLMPFAMKN